MLDEPVSNEELSELEALAAAATPAPGTPGSKENMDWEATA
jgi:hypothetical protein